MELLKEIGAVALGIFLGGYCVIFYIETFVKIKVSPRFIVDSVTVEKIIREVQGVQEENSSKTPDGDS